MTISSHIQNELANQHDLGSKQFHEKPTSG